MKVVLFKGSYWLLAFALMLFLSMACEGEPKGKEQSIKMISSSEDIIIDIGYYPMLDFLGLTKNDKEEVFYYADPQTRKELVFKDFGDSTLKVVDLKPHLDQLEKISKISVISTDSIWLFSREKALLINGESETLHSIELSSYIPENLKLYPIGSAMNHTLVKENYYFSTTSKIGPEEMNEEIEESGYVGWSKYYYSKEVENPHSIRLKILNDTVIQEEVASAFYKRFSKQPFFLFEVKKVFGNADTAFISSSFRKFIYVYSFLENNIIDSIEINTKRRVSAKPRLKIDSININRYSDSLNSPDYGGLARFFYNQEEKKYILIVAHDRTENKKPMSCSVIVYNKDFQEINEIVLDEGYAFFHSVYSNKYGLLIPKSNENKTAFTYYRIKLEP